MTTKALHGFVSGKVQGVWFRRFVKQHALRVGVTGYAQNLSDGRVEFLLQGKARAVQEVLRQIHQGPPLSRVDRVEFEEVKPMDQYQGFITT